MKKFSKLFATLGAVAMLGLGVFASCKSDDGDDDPVLSGIEVTEKPSKTLYTVGDADDSFDAAGLVITEKWTEGKADVSVTYSDENAAAFKFDGFSTSEANDALPITVTYKNKTATFDIKVVSAEAAATTEALAGKTVSVEGVSIAFASDGSATVTDEDGNAVEGATVTIKEDGSVEVVIGEETYTATIGEGGEVTVKDSAGNEKTVEVEETGFTSHNESIDNTAANLGAVAESASSSDETVATVAIADGKVTVTSKKAGTTTITAKASGYTDASVVITVAEDGTISVGTITKFVAEETPEVAPEPVTVVNALWDFKTNITGVADEAKFGEQTADTDLTGKGTNSIDSGTEKGATLKILKASSDLKWKKENDNDYGLYAGKKGDGTTAAGTYLTEYATSDYVKGKLELTLNDSAKVTLKVSGNGDEGENHHRWVVVTNADEKIVGSIDGLKKGEGNIVELKLNGGELLKAGTYTIWMNGSRLNAVEVKNDLTADVAKVKGVEIESNATSISYNGTATLTATPTYAGTPTLTYIWSIASGSGATVAPDSTDASKGILTANNETAEEVKVTVKVVVSDGTNEVDATSDEITIAAHGTTIVDEVKSVSLSTADDATSIDATGSLVLTATAEKTGAPTITYTWSVPAGSAATIVKDTDDPTKATLTGTNESAEEKSVVVTCSVSDGTNTKTDTKTITIKADTSCYYLGTLTGDEATSGKVYLFESGKEYLTNTRNGWQSKEYTFATLNEGKKSNYNTFDFKASHSATFKVKGVKALSALVYTTKDSSYKITAKKADGSVVLDTETISVTKDGGLQESIIFNTGTTEALTITLAGVGSESMYPIGFRLFDTEQEVITITKTPTVEESLLTAGTFTFEASSNLNASETFTWTSSDTAVASFASEASGTITYSKKGTTTITATASTGKTATYSLTVNELGLTLSPATATVGKDATKQLTATITPSGLTATRTITWVSSDANIATVSKNGVVTATADSGTATITATIEGTAISKTCTITAAEAGAGGNGGSVNFDCTNSESEIGAALAKIGDTTSAAKDVSAGTYDSVKLAITNEGTSAQLQKPKTTALCVQLKANAATATFTVTTGATIKVYACSSGSSNSTYYTVTGAAEGSATVEGTSSFTEGTYTATSDGTVTIQAPSKKSDGSTSNSNLRIQKITVTY